MAGSLKAKMNCVQICSTNLNKKGEETKGSVIPFRT